MRGEGDAGPEKSAHGHVAQRSTIATFVNTFFFLFAGFAALWLLLLAFLDTRGLRWYLVLYLVLLWATLAYIFLPRLYKLMTAVFLPDYFIGRARTGTGILGDVVNMAWDGPEENIHSLMQDAGWVLSTPITLKSALGIIRSVLTRSPDPDAPVSPLYLFGKQQDFAYQMDVGGSANKRHHIRFWRCPQNWPLPGGQTVDWLAAAAFDQGVRLSGFTLQVTHSISGDIDRERDFTIASVQKIDTDLKVSWIEKFSTAFHARNGGGDMVHTDGNLPIVDAAEIPEGVPRVRIPSVPQDEDPAQARTIGQFLKLTPRPLSLYFAAVVIVLGLVLNAQSLISGNTVSMALSWVAFVLTLAAPVALFFGRSWARELLMVLYGANVMVHFWAWVEGSFVVNAQTGIVHVGLSIVMLLVLSSEAVTNYTAEVGRWRRAHSRAVGPA